MIHGALPQLEVLLVTWNHWADTRECLASLFASDYTADQLRVWIVDNGSSDGTPGRIRAEFPQVHLIENTWNAGFAAAMNQSLRAVNQIHRESDEHWMALLLNNDTTVAPGMVRTLVGALDADARAGIAAPAIYYADQPELLWYAGGGLDPLNCRAWHEGIRTTGPVAEAPHPTGYATGCALLIEGDVLSQVGLLDEGYFMYWEDVDLCQRVKALGYSIVQVPTALMWHKVSTSTGGNLAPKKLWRKFASGYRFWGRYHQGTGWQGRYLASAWRDLRKAREVATR